MSPWIFFALLSEQTNLDLPVQHSISAKGGSATTLGMRQTAVGLFTSQDEVGRGRSEGVFQACRFRTKNI
eukprot:scaffold27705_cov17-Tisochrysis_lutea.AAC.1